MKEEYKKPEITVYEIETQPILAVTSDTITEKLGDEEFGGEVGSSAMDNIIDDE